MPSRIAEAVTVPSLAVVPMTWTVSPVLSADSDELLTTFTTVEEEVVTSTTVPLDSLTLS